VAETSAEAAFALRTPPHVQSAEMTTWPHLDSVGREALAGCACFAHDALVTGRAVGGRPAIVE
jgi:hypothetical protein